MKVSLIVATRSHRSPASPVVRRLPCHYDKAFRCMLIGAETISHYAGHSLACESPDLYQSDRHTLNLNILSLVIFIRCLDEARVLVY